MQKGVLSVGAMECLLCAYCRVEDSAVLLPLGCTCVTDWLEPSQVVHECGKGVLRCHQLCEFHERHWDGDGELSPKKGAHANKRLRPH
eukprot:scaffold52289_cov35-Tisochrysis_lutea.AAC.4